METSQRSASTWRCPVCHSARPEPRWRVDSLESEQGVSPDAFRPSSDGFGATVADVVRCLECGHASVAEVPDDDAMSAAYLDAADPVSLREEAGQVETGHRTLHHVEGFIEPGRVLDVGCWTGSLLVAARERGWEPRGIEPSAWACQRARDRGLDVFHGRFEEAAIERRSQRLVVACDVLEHLADPGAMLARARPMLDPEGGLLLTVPDAGSPLARAMGRRWWSVLPMHLQYFTRNSMRALLSAHGFEAALIRTHPKVFSLRYYAERLDGYSSSLSERVVAALGRADIAERLVAPNFGDRMLVIAQVRE